MQNYLIKNKGFTLIELLITMSIIAIISAVVFADSSSSEERLALKRAGYQVAQDLREVEEMALSSVAEVDCGSKDICGFGLKFNIAESLNSYLIFADCSDDCPNSNFQYDGEDKIIREVSLEKNIQIQQVLPSPLNVVFTAPDPVVWLNRTNWGVEAEITLKSSQSENRVVKVNSVGRVEIE